MNELDSTAARRPDGTAARRPDGTAALRPDGTAEAVVRRTPDGWRVGHEEVPDLTCAMALADLLAADLPADQDASRTQAAATAASIMSAAAPGQDRAEQPAGRKRAGPKQDQAATETSRLRTTIGQLERALIARIRVEQAIGVLAERHRIQPRQAFEQLRAAARNRGKRVIDIATDVVASASNPLLQLPDELSRPRSAGRSRARRGVLDQGAS